MIKVFVSENGIECENERSILMSKQKITVLPNPFKMKENILYDENECAYYEENIVNVF